MKVVVVNIHKHVKSLVLILIHEVLPLKPYALGLQAELIAATSVCSRSVTIAEKLQALQALQIARYDSQNSTIIGLGTTTVLILPAIGDPSLLFSTPFLAYRILDWDIEILRRSKSLTHYTPFISPHSLDKNSATSSGIVKTTIWFASSVLVIFIPVVLTTVCCAEYELVISSSHSKYAHQ